jgi:hypothetical protein
MTGNARNAPARAREEKRGAPSRRAADEKVRAYAGGERLAAGAASLYIQAYAQTGVISAAGAAALAPVLGNSAILELFESQAPPLSLVPFSFTEELTENAPAPFGVQAPPPLLVRGVSFFGSAEAPPTGGALQPSEALQPGGALQ